MIWKRVPDCFKSWWLCVKRMDIKTVACWCLVDCVDGRWHKRSITFLITLFVKDSFSVCWMSWSIDDWKCWSTPLQLRYGRIVCLICALTFPATYEIILFFVVAVDPTGWCVESSERNLSALRRQRASHGSFNQWYRRFALFVCISWATIRTHRGHVEHRRCDLCCDGILSIGIVS